MLRGYGRQRISRNRPVRPALVVAFFAVTFSTFGQRSAAPNAPDPAQDTPANTQGQFAPPLPPQAPTAAESAEASALYQAAADYDAAGSVANAITAYRAALKRYPLAREAGNAQYRLAELLEATGNLSRAFDAYQRLLTQYADTPNFERAVAAQVSIANQYLQGKPQTFLGIPVGNSAQRAAEMYRNILVNAPYSKYAPVAQFNLGLAYEKMSQPFEAIAAYRTVLDTYPNSDVCDDALYQIGFVYMRVGFAQQSQDLSSLVAAQNTFEDFLIEYPDSEKAPQARENMALLSVRESGDVFRIAKYYEFIRDYRAAAIYYNDVIRRQPNTEEATLAKSRLEELSAQYGEDALRIGPENAETGQTLALRRRLQAQVETSSLADFSGPPKRDVVPDELPAAAPGMRTSIEDVQPLPAVEPDLPTE